MEKDALSEEIDGAVLDGPFLPDEDGLLGQLKSKSDLFSCDF